MSNFLKDSKFMKPKNIENVLKFTQNSKNTIKILFGNPLTEKNEK